MEKVVEKMDPFDPASLRLDGSAMAADFGVKREILTVPVRKPAKDEWCRVHPDAGYCIQTGMLELKTEREVFLVARNVWAELSDESTFSCRAIFTAISRQGVAFLWPVRLPGPDGRIDLWNEAAMKAALLAREKWTRMAANMALGAYDIWTATAQIPDPVWPDKTFRELLSIAFRDRFLDSADHPVLQRLRGEA